MVALFVANAVSLSGNQLTNLAIPWFVYTTTDSAIRTGLVAICQILPTILFALFGGAIVDRLGAKRTSIVADLLSGVTVATIPLLYHTIGLPFWSLVLLVFLGAMLDAPGFTSRQAIFPDLIETAGMATDRANAAYQSVTRGAMIVGPPIAGVLVAAMAPSNVLWLDAVSFAISAALVWRFVPDRTAPAVSLRDAASGSYLDEIRDGLRFLARDRFLRVVAIVVGILNFLEAPLNVALPVYARDTLDSSRALGFLWASLGAGALGGSILYAAVAPRLPRYRTFVIAIILGGLPLLALAATPPLAVALVALFVSGLASGPPNPILMSIRQERVPPELRGRVFGANTAIAMGAMPLGLLVGSVLIDAAGVGAAFWAISVSTILMSLWLLISPTLRAMDEKFPEKSP